MLTIVLVLVIHHSDAAAQQPLTADAGFARQALAGCDTDLHWLNQISGWQTQWPTLLENQPLDTEDRRAAFLASWRPAPAALAAAVDSLRSGMRGRGTAPAAVVRRVLEQIDPLVDGGAEDAAVLSPSRRAEDPAFEREWTRIATAELGPAIRRYRDFLRNEYLPRATTEAGMSALADGASCFEGALEWWTSLTLPVEEVERRGREQITELQEELVGLAAPDFGTSPEQILARLRARRFAESFESREDVIEHARAAIARARRQMPEWFATTGELEIDVVELSRQLESSFPAGFYRPPGASGSAAYVVNTSRPQDRRLLSEVITFHEAIPGHHTSFAVPAAMNGAGGVFNSGYVEGWAIYAERLADEMGLYSGQLDRIGLVTKHLWASSRLVVEPGIHLHGWSREEAISFMLAHTALPREEIEVEVDRYAAMPGQSLAYMLGYLEFERIRDVAERRAGDAFDIREFHDVVLGPGIRPLSEVAEDVADWVEGMEGA